jgi:uncharacterized GH25 family protein
MKRFLISCAAFSAIYSPAAAHDFWIAPKAFHADSAGTIPVAIMIGHPKDKSRWALNPHRIISLKSHSPDGITDHQGRMDTLMPNGDMLLSFEGDGTHLMMIETTSATSVLPADKFNDYLREEGLSPIKIDRARKETEDEDGREIYSRRGKTLIQIGPFEEGDASYVTRPLGMTLEITPQVNPYALKPGEPLTSTTTYRGKPAKGVSIGLISLDTEAGLVDVKMTNAKGEVSFDRPETGQWMLHAVWSDPLEDTSNADYDTIFSSLSFGFK